MKVFDHIPVADKTASQRNKSVWYRIVSILARACIHNPKWVKGRYEYTRGSYSEAVDLHGFTCNDF